MDVWLVVNLGVHLQLAKKFDISRITIYHIWMHMLKSFMREESETYLAVSQKNKSGRYHRLWSKTNVRAREIQVNSIALNDAHVLLFGIILA